eukprot:TRINITY_DN1234_c0_g2_i3.p2 TRINITY_DN1234_c0_g2~~TRINITY_DN1234_c0_g2_i3.p2  ORF type:complete len:233 (-),score=-22.34 TRINITY_DN1234_c0_g2_i3:1056-1754(-)
MKCDYSLQTFYVAYQYHILITNMLKYRYSLSRYLYYYFAKTYLVMHLGVYYNIHCFVGFIHEQKVVLHYKFHTVITNSTLFYSLYSCIILQSLFSIWQGNNFNTKFHFYNMSNTHIKFVINPSMFYLYLLCVNNANLHFSIAFLFYVQHTCKIWYECCKVVFIGCQQCKTGVKFLLLCVQLLKNTIFVFEQLCLFKCVSRLDLKLFTYRELECFQIQFELCKRLLLERFSKC